MEIPDPEIKISKGGAKRDLRPDEASLIVGETASGLIGTQGSLNILRHVQKLFLQNDEARRPKGISNEDYPPTEIERFVKADHPSHLLKVAELERFIEIAKQSTRIIDETDISGAAIWDYISEDDREEINRQLEGLKSTAALKDALEAEMANICSDTWQSHKETKTGSEKERYERLENLLIGPDASTKEQAELRQVRSEILKTEELYEMLGMEKIRLVMNAATAPDELKLEKEKNAYEVLGNDYYLIKNQMEHMENCLKKDWLKCMADEGITTPLSGKALIGPELSTRINGEPSEEQIKALEESYSWMAFNRKENHSSRDSLAEKTAFCLSAMQVLELGKKAKFINVAKEINMVAKEKAQEAKLLGRDPVPPPIPDEYLNPKENLKEGANKAGGGVGRIIGQWPQMLALHIWAASKTKAKQEQFGQYSSMEDHVKVMSQIMNAQRIDEPM
jgi:hypothetical protein